MAVYLKKSVELYKNALTKNEKTLRICLIAAGEVLSAFTLVYLITLKEFTHIKMAIGSFFIVLVPVLIEILFRCRMRVVPYIAAELYAISPLLGECYKLYYTTDWWDKMLHTFGGVAFVLFGVYLFRRMCKNEPKRITAAVFALCFSISISVLWEFVEYAGDNLFDMDMQNDTLVEELHSYYFGDAPGVPGDIRSIDSVTINGNEVPFKGYLDIGLHDTMQDMLIETFGALIAVVFILINKEKTVLFIPLSEDEMGGYENG